MTFNITELTGDRYLVEGTDVRGKDGQLVVDGSEWNHLRKLEAMTDAHERFDAKVEEFFADLIEAADALEQEHKVELDPMLYVVEQEGSAGVAAVQEQIRVLTHDTVVLRTIAMGAGDRLIWVGGSLELTKTPIADPTTPVTTVPDEGDGEADVEPATEEDRDAAPVGEDEVLPQPGYDEGQTPAF